MRLPEGHLHGETYKYHKKEAGTKETGRQELTLALAMGALKGGEGLREVPVLPQQLLEQLLPGVKGALRSQSIQ